jgi:hypothetical protein
MYNLQTGSLDRSWNTSRRIEQRRQALCAGVPAGDNRVASEA